jgi:hypothetical protein
MIKEPQKTYLLELITELGNAAEDFVLTGAQAMAFNIENPRYSKDFDFLLDVISLRKSPALIAGVLRQLKYKVDPKAQNFHFTKEIPGSNETMRVDFMASDKEKRPGDFRVEVEKGIHACRCEGAEIVLQQSDYVFIEGALPDGNPAKIKIRFAKPNSVLMLKLLAMDDSYRNLRGSKRTPEDRERAQVHSSDSIKIVRCNIQNGEFKGLFWSQLDKEALLKERCNKIISEYFKNLDAPGIQLYREFLQPQGAGSIDEADVNRALREIRLLL